MPEGPILSRPIPSTGEAMPAIGLGTWPVFDVGTDEVSRRPLREVVRLLVEGGGRMIDTSPMYGRSEGVVGDLVAELGLRPRVFLATKVWTSGREAGLAQMQRSAALLRADTIDLMQIHNLVDWRTHLSSLRHLKETGHIRYIGITHYTTSSLPNWRASSPPSPASILSSAAIRSPPAPPRPHSSRSPPRAGSRSSSTSPSSRAHSSAGCAASHCPNGPPNSTARVGPASSSNTSSPSPRSPV